MSTRNTTTGSVLEQMIIPALERTGYAVEGPLKIGYRPSGKKHIVDRVATAPTKEKYLISTKWQQVSGTAEEKIPYEVICLADAVQNSNGMYKKAYLVLGGNGWTLREWYVKGGLRRYLLYSDTVEIVTLESFICIANKRAL